MPTFDGISILWLHDNDKSSIIASDACLVGHGATYGNEYFHIKFDDFLLGRVEHISQLEL